ncbi:MAG: hypothetical protein R3277_12805 [Brumimicrobium sp.]|nr:hypothetical protein [Brumimicrobium sp.]
MGSFWKRLKFYLVGFTIGLIFVIFFFQNRGCAWTPQNRVKNAILDKVIVAPSEELEELKRNSISSEELYLFMAQGDVNFEQSLKEQNVYPKVYVIERGEGENKKRIQFSLFEDSFISTVHFLENGEKAKRVRSFEGEGVFLRLPKDSALVFIDKSNYVQCKARGLLSTDQDVLIKNLKNSGKILFDKSDLMLPKAEHYITFQQNDTLQVEAKAIWYESRITFKDFYWDEKLPCED